MTVYAPSIVLTRLFQKKSAAGRRWFAGRLGSTRVAVVQTKEVSSSGGSVWEVREAPHAARPAPPANVHADTGQAAPPLRTAPKRVRPAVSQ
jgi:hypothetical protein